MGERGGYASGALEQRPGLCPANTGDSQADLMVADNPLALHPGGTDLNARKSSLLMAVAGIAFAAAPAGARGVDATGEAFREARGYTVKVRTQIRTPFVEDERGSFHGSGFLVDAERGWIVTNAHVVGQSPSEVEVAFAGDEYRPARKQSLHDDDLPSNGAEVSWADSTQKAAELVHQGRAPPRSSRPADARPPDTSRRTSSLNAKSIVYGARMVGSRLSMAWRIPTKNSWRVLARATS